MINTQLKKGLLDTCVLSTLSRGDSYGYRILKDLPESLDISESTLYPILRRLESGNCVTSYSLAHEGRLRKMYAITETGTRQIQEFMEDLKEIEEIFRYIEEGLHDDER